MGKNSKNMSDQNGPALRRWLLATALHQVALPSASPAPHGDGKRSALTDQTSSTSKDRSALGRTGFVLSLREIHGFALPEEVRKLPKVTVAVQVTFFDFASQSFFGNTYRSEPVPAPTSDAGEDDAWPIEQLVYFTTARKSPKCVGVVEVVASSSKRY